LQKIINSEFEKLESFEDDKPLDVINNYKKIVHSLDDRITTHNYSDTPHGKAIKDNATQVKIGERNKEYLHDISEDYKQALKIVSNTITSLIQGNNDCAEEFEKIIQKFVSLFLTDKNILLNISQNKPDSIEHLFSHSLNVCILAINIAASYGYSEEQVVEIGTGALLHDTGMFLIPEQIRYKHGRFSNDEWYEMKKHPILGLHLLEKVKGLPNSVMFIAYQTHERLNASGYPKQRSEYLIHKYAKIVQVADVYEALSSPRPHRKESLPYESVEKLIKMSHVNLISKDFVKAFVIYLSTHPIGSIVQLSNNCIGKVVETNADAPGKPIVSVLTNVQGNLLPKKFVYQIDTRDMKSISIVKALARSEYKGIGIMDGF